ncbi:sulfopyruvate decarboxylase subunit beta [Bacillus stratosphericus LAMA 585]|nr:sulfopyruvate decarboxylase subunit beta [Bacillus stratosphericus LAMA 585]
MNKIDVFVEFNKFISNELVVSPLGETSEIWKSINERDNNFYMLGSMGMPISFGLGLALGTTENVYVIDGDGSLLMNLGGLSTVAKINQKNLKIIILDNGCYATTGGQLACTSDVTSLNEVAIACGIKEVHVAHNTTKFKELLNETRSVVDTSIIFLKINNEKSNSSCINLLPEEISSSFRKHFAKKIRTNL